MIAYVVLFALILLSEKTQKKVFIAGNYVAPVSGRKMYLYIVAVILIFFMGLRATSVGCDVIQYLYRYENATELYNIGLSYSEWGFNYISYFFHNILNVDFQVFLFAIAILCVSSISTCVYRYSDNILLSIITYLTVGNFTMNLSGLRQTVAISIVLFSILVAEKKKLVPFFALVMLASVIHNSAVVFFPVYFLWGRRLNRKTGAILLIISVAAIAYRTFLNPLIGILSPERYSIYNLTEGYAINPLVILVPIVFCVYSLFFMKQDGGEFSQKDSFFFIFSCINVFTSMLSLSNNQLGRLGFYFAIGNMIVISSAVQGHKENDYRVAHGIEYLIVILCFLYFFISTPGGTLSIDNYLFFWQQ